MKITYHGHSCVQITDGEHSIVIDPFVSGNPLSKTKSEDIQVNYILLTHGHGDHIADALPIAQANNAPIVATFELANYMAWQGAKTVETNLGGTVDLGFAKAQMVHAFHSSSVIVDEQQSIQYMGMPGGFIIHWNGKTLYHAGDTGLFSDMKMIGERNDIDLAFLPIGDTYTMGPEDAAQAAEWLGAKQVVPIHFNTFPPIKQNAQQFIRQLSELGIEGIALKPGEHFEL